MSGKRTNGGDRSCKCQDCVTNRIVVARLIALYADLLTHDGFGEIRVEVRILKRRRKEVIIHCGSQYRFVVDFVPDHLPEDLLELAAGIKKNHISGRSPCEISHLRSG